MFVSSSGNCLWLPVLCDILALEGEDLSVIWRSEGEECKRSHSIALRAIVRPHPTTVDLRDPRQSAGRRRPIRGGMGVLARASARRREPERRRRTGASGGEEEKSSCGRGGEEERGRKKCAKNHMRFTTSFLFNFLAKSLE